MSAKTQTQRALLLKEIKKPLVLSEWPIPQPGPSQIQIKVSVAGVNPSDQRFRDTGLLIGDKLPHILAADVVGVVTALGSNVSTFSVGDRVVSQAVVVDGTQCGFQEYAVFDADYAAEVPESFSDDDAAELPTNVVTGAVALFGSKELALPAPWGQGNGKADLEGVTLLIIGGGSNCGRFGVQLAAAAGIGRIVVLGGDETELKSWGATEVLNRHGSDDEVVARIRKVVGDELLYVYDAVNFPDKLHIAINALSNSKKGKVARLIPMGVPDEGKINVKEAGYEMLDVLGYPRVRQEVGKEFWAHLPQLLQDGRIKPTKSVVVEEGLNADKANAVLDAYKEGKKVVKTHFHNN